MYLAMITVDAKPLMTEMAFPNPEALEKCRPLPTIRDAEVTVHRSFVFSANDPGFLPDTIIPPHYTINGKTFHDQEPIQIRLNTAEEWTLRVPKQQQDPSLPQESPHPFHIHVNAFQILDGPNTGSQRNGFWRDTLIVQPGETYRIRSRFLDFPGRTVFHCHILDHEDQGMMMPIVFSNQNQALPPQKICKELRAPATKLTSKATPAPSLKVPDSAGGIHDLVKFRGRNVVLVFFQGVQCAHCVEKLRDLVHEARGLSGSEAEIVAISSRRIDDRPRALNFLGVGEADKFHLLVDESQQSFRDFGCFNGQPQHGLFLIDRNGIIRASYIGETPFSDTGEVIRRVRRTATSGGLLSR